MPFVPGGASGDAGENEMDDVVGHVVLAEGDEDLLAGDALGAVAVLADGLRAERADVGTRLGSVRFIVPVHSPDTIGRRYTLLLLLAAVVHRAVDRALREERAQRPRHVGGG